MLERILKKATLIDVLIILISSIGIVGFWRGIWNILDKYVYPNNFLLSNLLTMAIGVIILVVLSKIE